MSTTDRTLILAYVADTVGAAGTTVAVRDALQDCAPVGPAARTQAWANDLMNRWIDDGVLGYDEGAALVTVPMG